MPTFVRPIVGPSDPAREATTRVLERSDTLSRWEFQTPTFPDKLVVAVRRLNSVSDGKVGVWNSPILYISSVMACQVPTRSLRAALRNDAGLAVLKCRADG